MISLSNLIKSTHYVSLDDKKTIEVQEQLFEQFSKTQHADEEQLGASIDAETEALKEQILKDAEAFASQLIESAKQEAADLKEAARQEIEAWWNERRQQDASHVEALTNSAMDEGYRSGLEQAEQQVKAQYENTINEASSVLEQAHIEKLNIIQEAEPFLIELSVGIAQKIIGKQLSVEPDWTIQLVKKVLARKKDHGLITLCVSPSQHAYIQDARDELLLVIDSQAELQIIPDATVQDHGCVVRSAYGSVDARIDTQLQEIKKALLQIAAVHEEDE